MRRVHLKISGRVQGVFFRANTKKKATSLGLTGWVKNTEEGVEVVAEGENGKLKALIDWCHEGPVIAKVEKIDVQEEKYTGSFTDFTIAY